MLTAGAAGEPTFVFNPPERMPAYSARDDVL
jgi:hypothetical protein